MFFHRSEIVISAVARTDVGRRRANNEDAFLMADLGQNSGDLPENTALHPVSKDGLLLAVADGMGGAAAGEIASRRAVSSLREELNTLPNQGSCRMRLIRAAELANQRVWNAAQQQPEYRGMGTTLTAAFIRNDHVCIAQVGDSRAYLIRHHQVIQLTRDQSLVQSLIDAGSLTAEEAKRFPQRNVLLQALGHDREVSVAMTEFSLQQGDYLLLCSDGLSNKVAEPGLLFAIENTATLEDACRLLIGWANARGGEDNITVVLAHFDDAAAQRQYQYQPLQVQLAA